MNNHIITTIETKRRKSPFLISSNKQLKNNDLISNTITLNYSMYLEPKSYNGRESILTAEDPFIDYLIKKRINFCKVGPSSHIAAFVPNLARAKWCLIPGKRGKRRGRRKLR